MPSNIGEHQIHSYHKLGAHLAVRNGEKGVFFSVWAPNAKEVGVVGDFNNWQSYGHKMTKSDSSGIWTIFIPFLQEGELYKYEILTYQDEVLLKADPYAFYSEYRPRSASIVYSLEGYHWNDDNWLKIKQTTSVYNEPMLIYEVHLGTWKRKVNGDFYSYRELADELVNYVAELGYTHIEILPLAEHPFDRSWGYQITGYYSITSRYGTPRDFMYFVDCCHQKGIGVILDWVPCHFCKDSHGLIRFDGTPLYEYQDPQKAEKHEWGTLSFDFEKPQVRKFLIANAIFLFDVFHIDGLRVDAVASMLYLDYGKKDNQWVPNIFGDNRNLEAVSFFKELNEEVFRNFPQALMIAEESSAWPMVSAPTYLGGLGFNYKWNMGWMNDILKYFELQPSDRKYHHKLLTFSFFYAFSENFVLPFSHDEVVHGKKSLLNKMPGDYWQKFANLRLLLAYMIAHPGKKLTFMGTELGQFDEWKDEGQIDWQLTDFEMHKKTQDYIGALNKFYIKSRALWELDHHQQGFQWIDPHNEKQSIVSFLRRAKNTEDFLLIVCNFTPVFYKEYLIGVPVKGDYVEIFNSDLKEYGGSGQKNPDILHTSANKWHNQPFSLKINIPPLATVIFEAI